jgi:hypothetical protein
MRHARNAAAAMVVVALMLGAAGCSSSAPSDESSAGSRATLYDSVDELAADSTAIINGVVTDQFTEGDATVSVIPVDNVPFSPQLAANAGTPPSDVQVGDTVQVRQDPSSRPLLEIGKEYFLWLTPTMLPGAAASQFFVTGSNAGIYISDGDAARRAAPDSGDDLPATITIGR